MRGKSLKAAVATAAVALIAAGCTSTPEPETPSDTGGELRIYASEPASLFPPMADDNPSIVVIRQIYKGLVEYDTKGAPVNVIADSITSSDNKVWTIKLKSGFKFTNDEPVTADSFINAWNFTAYGPNAATNSYFLSNIGGYDALQSKDPDGDGPKTAPEPAAKTLSGLKKIDDTTFEVTLTKAFSGFPAQVGYSGYFPVAKACLDDVKACTEKPIGNGAYKIEGSWEHNVQVKLSRNDAYTASKGKADTLVFKIYDKQETGYADFKAGELDIFEAVPSAEVKAAMAQYGERFFQKPSNNFTYVGLPLYDARFQDKKIRQALSLAIDRQAIIDAVFDGRFSAAQGVVSPNFLGYRDGACANCKYDPVKAKSLLDEAGGWKGGKIVLWANAGAGHEKWMQAVGDGWKKDLGIDYELNTSLQFPEYLAKGDQKKFDGPFRLGWGPDYPWFETYLAPLYGTGGSSNNSGYTNPAFDQLVEQGNGAKTQDEGIKFYQQAEDVIVDDLPVIPMWFGKVSDVYSENVKTFVFNPISGVEYDKVVLNPAK
ncbi:putative peptide ABC transporter DppA [Catellatospora sp. TT07R-123]|uniref:peptide ABC transporter substrate-binding protein n=1 Tax=Catellatospora sp. TT07R-123 TaxID=2733863 RepID=UPI001B1AC62E|nr:ABC transporter substrate-binding protein [Catellatospora sp. TT07R-123]GHJ46057.1 putative peptide ABC transporter DppA [Catellatospora sp. TT07R-123]